MTEILIIDPKLWAGEAFEERLRRHFIDIRTIEGFREFLEARRDRDASVALESWHRIFDRSGRPILAAFVTWKEQRKLWRFPLLSRFVDPQDERTHLVFDAKLPRIGLDLGIALNQSIYEALPGITPDPH